MIDLKILSPNDLTQIYAIIDLQELPQQVKDSYKLSYRLKMSSPGNFIFGEYDDEKNRFLNFINYSIILPLQRNKFEAVQGIYWSLDKEIKYLKFYNEHTESAIIDFFRKKHFTVFYNISSLDRKWTSLFDDPTKFKSEIVETVPANTRIKNPVLEQHLTMFNFTFPQPTKILKYTDLNPLPMPEFQDEPVSVEHPPHVPVPKN